MTTASYRPRTTGLEHRPRRQPPPDRSGRSAHYYGSHGRARHVPDQVVGQGSSRSLADRPASPPTWIAAHSGHGRASLIRMRSVVQVHLGPPPGHPGQPPDRQALSTPSRGTLALSCPLRADRPVTQGIPRSPTDSPPPSGVWQLSGAGTHPLWTCWYRRNARLLSSISRC